jgi:hypothetical protein
MNNAAVNAVVLVGTVIVAVVLVGIMTWGMFVGRDMVADDLCKARGATSGKWDNTNKIAVCSTVTFSEAK